MAKPQSKTQKKIDNNLRLCLQAVCEQALKDEPGFMWLTHRADYANFPASLLITCVYDTEQDRLCALDTGRTRALQKRVHASLLKTGVVLRKMEQQVMFDSEEACLREHNGDWQARLGSRRGLAIARNRPG